jgi:hypothetical protein
MSTQTLLLWQDPAWQKQAHDWIRTETARQSIRITSEIEQPHMYPWSTVLRVPSNGGTLFFKATAAETVYESALTQMLAGWYPDCIPELIAVDTRRGWMLMRDGGEQLRLSIRPVKDVTPWNPVISRYSEVQVGLAEHSSEILALGIPDHRLAALPALYTQLLRDEESLLIDQEKGLISDEWEQLKPALLDEFAQLKTWLTQKKPEWFQQDIEYPGSDGALATRPLREESRRGSRRSLAAPKEIRNKSPRARRRATESRSRRMRRLRSRD